MTASAQGQDRSVYQPVTGWDGLAFGIVKATEATTLTDATFAANWAALKKAGLPRGAYHFLHPAEDAVTQARHFHAVVSAAGLAAGDMLWCDSETVAGNADEATLAFLDELRSLAPAGVVTGTYSNHAAGSLLHRTAAAYPDLWFAWPSPVAPSASFVAPWKTWRFWQWGEGKLGDGEVDLDAYNGTEDELRAWLHPAPVRVEHWRSLGLWSLAHEASAHSTTPAEMIHLAAAAGHVYGPAMRAYVAAGDFEQAPAGRDHPVRA